MTKAHTALVAGWLATATAGILIGAVMSGPVIADERVPEVSSDGLHLLKNSKVRMAYAKPGATLDQYSKVMILDCYVDFVEDWQHDYNLNEIGLQGRVTDKDAERIKRDLAAEFKKVFSEQLTKKGHPVVEEPGPDVLLLRPALLNVDVTAPDLMQAGRSRTYIESAGSMTLYMELYDSATSTLLARVVDPRADPNTFAQPASRVTNKAAADRLLRSWADLLASHLADIQQQTAGN